MLLDIATKLDLEKKVDLASWCAKNADAYLRRINPRLRFVQTKAMCRGDTHDFGYAELVDFDVHGSEHSYRQLRAFAEFKEKNMQTYGE